MLVLAEENKLMLMDPSGLDPLAREWLELERKHILQRRREAIVEKKKAAAAVAEAVAEASIAVAAAAAGATHHGGDCGNGDAVANEDGRGH